MVANVDLNELRIEHVEERHRASRGSRVWMVLFFVLLVVSAAAIAYLATRGGPGSAVTVRVERVAAAGGGASSGAASAGAFSAAGWVKLPRYHPVQVTPLVEGRLDRVSVIEGARVSKGQELARLYDRDYQAALDAAEAALRAAVAEHEKRKTGYRPQEVAEARAEVKRLEAELENARRVLENSEKLEPSGAIPREELDIDRTRVATLTANLDRARQRAGLLEEGFRQEDIALAGAAVEQARAERDLAALRLSYTRILSPMNGVVLNRYGIEGQWIKPAEGVVVSLYDPRDLEARIDVNQDDVARVHMGQDVELTTRAEPGRMHRGRVVLIEPQADLVKNTVPVRVKIQDPEKALLHPDMVVKARFLPKRAAVPKDGTGKKRPRVGPTVPVIAVVSDGDARHVFVVEDDRALRRRVTLGPLENGRYTVTDGLKGGELVVVEGVDRVTDGTRVRIEK